MAVLRRSNLVGTPQPSAGMVRERLLHDRQMRRNQGLPGHRSSASVLLSPGILQPQALSPYQLSSAEQQRQAIQIARTFNHHYLAAIRPEGRVVVAVVRPIPGRAYRREWAHEIQVDAAGNVNIAPWSPDAACGRRIILVRNLMLAGMAILALAGLLLIL